MIIDSSAILAIVFGEPEAPRMALAIAQASVRQMSAVNWFETLMVVEGRYGRASSDETLLILKTLEVEALAFDAAQITEARSAWQRLWEGASSGSTKLGRLLCLCNGYYYGAKTSIQRRRFWEDRCAISRLVASAICG